MDWINELLYNAMMYTAQNFISEAVNTYMGALVSLREIALDLLSNTYYRNAILYTQGIAVLLLAVKVAFEAKTIHILRLDGNPDADPMGLLKGTGVAAAMIASMPWIVHQAWVFGLSIQRDVSQIPGTDIGSEQDALLNFFVSCVSQPGGALFIGVIVAVIIFLLVTFQSLVFAVDITVHAVIGFWMALGLTNSQSNSFSVWWKDTLGTALIPALQLFVLKGAFTVWGSFTMDMGTKLLLFIVLMYSAYRVPQKVQQYIGYTGSGVGKSTINVAQTVFSKLLMRR